MLCEKCAQESTTVTCSRCGQAILDLGPYCYHCGGSLRSNEDQPGVVENRNDTDSPDPFDFSARILCSDGACIGVVNEQGICKVCGKQYVPES